ncbi:hypothetical protein Goari_002405 [Gossypium aridum]|uniref:Uncharacterized protein n=1 Tax=Gossypium aridum TaxID=34290 RepID=A0A7J8Y879_GOSAI|nr:hypothetical protein [Gossypium aridum]
MHVVGSTFKGVIRSEIKDEFFRIRVNLDVQKQLQRGIFSIGSWVECSKIPSGDHVKADDDYPFSLELKAESSILEKEKWEDKSNKNWCVEVDNSKDNSEMEGPTNLIGAHHLGHKKSSWYRLVKRHKSDSNMSEITTDKRKFNQESAEGPEPYSYVEDVTKRVKFDDGNSEAFTIVEALWPITNEDVDSSKTYLVAAKWSADRKQ